jgi:hypothetical protein
LLPSEIDAVQQVEAAALGLKRRAQHGQKENPKIFKIQNDPNMLHHVTVFYVQEL